MSATHVHAACVITPDEQAEVPSAQAPVRVCVIDLGTNSFHAIIVDAYANGSFTIVDKMKEMVQLGERGLSEHRLTDVAMERGIEALRRIRILADGWNASEYLAFATSAIREAENGGDFIVWAREETDIHIRPISGAFEARLIYQGVRRAVDLTEPTLLADIGGGSTECIVATHDDVFFAASLKLGAARMTERFITTDPVERREFKALRNHFRTVLQPVFEAARTQHVRTIVGSSGTMENIAQVYVNQVGDSSRSIFQQALDAQAVRRVTKRLMRSTKAEREAMKGIDQKRVDQVVAGAMLVDVLLKDLTVEQLVISPNALREGMVVHFIEQNYERLELLAPYADVRRRSIHELGFRCQWERPHAQQVATLALQLFDATRPLHELGLHERELLEYAALLHDIGYHISRSGHHKHGLYLIQKADLKGFQPEEIDIMANVVRYHRKALPKKKHGHFTSLPKRQQTIVRQLASLLRLAEGLDRSHFQNVTGLRTHLTDSELLITIQTKGDPQLDVWGAHQHVDLFEDTFDCTVEVRAEAPVLN